MRIGLFSDSHYCDVDIFCSNRRPRLAFERIKESMDAFKEQGVEAVFCLGDLIDAKEDDTKSSVLENLKKILSMIRPYNIPFYLIHGNHDYMYLSRADFEKEGIKAAPYTIDTEEIRFIILDANYNSKMECFDSAKFDWGDSNLPKEQVEFLKDALNSSQPPCVVMVHENLDPTVHSGYIIKNAEEIRKIISSSKKVKAVIQGHYHEGSYAEIDGIPYLTLSAMCEAEENPYKIIEIQ